MVIKEKERMQKLVLLPSSIDCRGWSLADRENLCECYDCKSRLFFVRREWGVVDTGSMTMQVAGWKDKAEPHLELQEIGLALFCAECGAFVDDYSKFCYPEDKIICSWDDEDLDSAEIEELHWAVYAFNITGKIEKEYESTELKLLKRKIDEYFKNQEKTDPARDIFRKEGLTDVELKELCCPNGSLTCGLLTKLFPDHHTRRCDGCKKHQEDLK